MPNIILSRVKLNHAQHPYSVVYKSLHVITADLKLFFRKLDHKRLAFASAKLSAYQTAWQYLQSQQNRDYTNGL